ARQAVAVDPARPCGNDREPSLVSAAKDGAEDVRETAAAFGRDTALTIAVVAIGHDDTAPAVTVMRRHVVIAFGPALDDAPLDATASSFDHRLIVVVIGRGRGAPDVLVVPEPLVLTLRGLSLGFLSLLFRQGLRRSLRLDGSGGLRSRRLRGGGSSSGLLLG